MRVDVAAAVAELLRAGVVGVAEHRRRPQVPALAHVLARGPDRVRARLRLGRGREVDRRLREVELRLGQADVLERVRRGDGDEERAWVGVADVLGGEDGHPAGDEARILAAFEHRGEVVDGRVRVGAAHRLDEGGDEVVVLVGALVVAQRPLAGGVVDVALLERRPLGLRGLPRELDRRERGARVAAGPPCDQRDDLVGHVRVDRGSAAPDDLGQLLLDERLELDHLAAGEQRRVDLEVRVLGRRADQRQQPLFDRGQERVLLRLVEAVDLVEEEDRPLAVPAEAVAGPLHDPADVVDARRDSRELLEGRAGLGGDDPRQRRLPDARRAVEDQRAQPVLLDRPAQRRSFAEHVRLAHQLGERARPEALRQRRVRGRALRGRRRRRGRSYSQYAPAVATHEDYSEPILAGEGASDYERYLNTDALLALQKSADEWVHRDELLFQTVHQSSELWLKLAWNDVEAATRTCRPARLRRRCGCCGARRSASTTRRRSSTCSSRCRRGSTRRSARCSATAAASTRPAGARSAA